MSKLAVVATVALVVASWGLGGEAVQATPLERLVPADAVALVQATDLPELRKAFDASVLAEHIRASQLLNYFYTVVGAAAEFGTVLVRGRPAEELQACMGGQLGIVLLDFKSPAEAKERVPVALLLEAAEPQKLEQILTTQLGLLTLLRPELGLTSREHGGRRVHEIELPQGARLAWSVRDRFVVVGSRYSVDTLLDGKGPGIGSNPRYLAVREQLATAGGLTAYVDVAKLMQRSGVAADPAQLQKLRGAGLSEVKAAGLAIDFHDRQVRERLYLHTAGPQTGLLKFLTTGAPAPAATSHFVPPTYSVVATASLKDVGLWDRLKALLVETQGDAAAGNMDIGANMVLQNLGIQIKEGFLDTLADELFVAVDLSKLPQFAGAGRQPKPQEIPFVVGARIRNAPALTDTFERIAANERLWEQGIERAAAKHRETDVYTFRVPFNANLRPTYAVVDNVLLFSIRPEAVRAAIDAHKTKKSFATTTAAAGLAGPAHLRLQTNDAQLLLALLGLIRNDLPQATRRLLPELERILGSLHGHAAVLRRQPQGVSLVAQSDLGTTGTFLAAAVLIDQFHAVVAKRVGHDFDSIAKALDAYHAKHNAYPETLDLLVPQFLPVLPRDRFEPKRGYGYQRAAADPGRRFPDAWVLTSVGPDKKVDIPVEQFDPADWLRRARNPQLDELPALKRVIYQFRREQFKDERKNDDEGDVVRMGVAERKPGTTPKAAKPKPALKPPDF